MRLALAGLPCRALRWLVRGRSAAGVAEAAAVFVVDAPEAAFALRLLALRWIRAPDGMSRALRAWRSTMDTCAVISMRSLPSGLDMVQRAVVINGGGRRAGAVGGAVVGFSCRSGLAQSC